MSGYLALVRWHNYSILIPPAWAVGNISRLKRICTVIGKTVALRCAGSNQTFATARSKGCDQAVREVDLLSVAAKIDGTSPRPAATR